MGGLYLAVLLSGTWAILALIALYVGARAHGKRKLYSVPKGDPAKGVAYAFTGGMLPWAKESVRTNLPSYLAGVVFHGGVAAAFLLLLAALTGWAAPLPLARIATLAGALGGMLLLVKRLAKPELRGLSGPDDFVSNLLTSGFVLLALASTLHSGFEGPWMIGSILLLLYIPVGKIRHCVFFFSTRCYSGAFFGRRGTFPPGADHV